MNAKKYKIAVQEVFLDGETVFEATVAEFPDVAVYDEDEHAAREIALEVVEGLIEMAEEMLHPIPQPFARSDVAPSGKLTFRPGRSMHRQIAAAADLDGVSQNQWLCNAVASVLSTTDAITELRAIASNAFAHVITTSAAKWSTYEEPRHTLANITFERDCLNILNFPTATLEEFGIGRSTRQKGSSVDYTVTETAVPMPLVIEQQSRRTLAK